MINIADLLRDPDLTGNYQVVRKTTSIVATGDNAGEAKVIEAGRYVRMSVQPIKPKDIDSLPEGIRSSKIMTFYAASEVISDDGDPITGSSSTIVDSVVWGDNTYRLVSVEPWSDYGYWKAIGVVTGRATI